MGCLVLHNLSLYLYDAIKVILGLVPFFVVVMMVLVGLVLLVFPSLAIPSQVGSSSLSSPLLHSSLLPTQRMPFVKSNHEMVFQYLIQNNRKTGEKEEDKGQASERAKFTLKESGSDISHTRIEKTSWRSGLGTNTSKDG